MPSDRAERRRAPRVIPARGQPLSIVRLRTGRELEVVDISCLGALLQGPARLLPGTHVDVHVTGAHGRILVRARVLRCAVCRVLAAEVSYRGAVAFNAVVDLGLPEIAAGRTAMVVAGDAGQAG
jgi:hypothetical protein